MLILLAVLVIVVNLGVVFYLFSLLAESPFIRVPSQVVPEIINLLNLENARIFYDLGCGDGRVLFAAYKAYPKVKYLGIEINWFPFLLASVKKILLGSPRNIVLVRGDMYTQNCSDADLVFCYLFPKPIQRVWNKLQEELKPGARLVSCHFRPVEPPDQEIILKNASPTAKKLYIYNSPSN